MGTRQTRTESVIAYAKSHPSLAVTRIIAKVIRNLDPILKPWSSDWRSTGLIQRQHAGPNWQGQIIFGIFWRADSNFRRRAFDRHRNNGHLLQFNRSRLAYIGPSARNESFGERRERLQTVLLTRDDRAPAKYDDRTIVDRMAER